MAEEAKKDEAQEQNAEGAGDDLAKSKKKRLVIFGVIGFLVVAGAGGGAAYFLMGGGGKDPAADEAAHGAETVTAEGAEHAEAAPEGEAEHAEGAEPSAGAKPADGHSAEGADHAKAGTGKAAPAPAEDDADSGIDFGDTYKMEPFSLNLGNPLENRYVRLEIALEYRGGETQKAEIEKRLPQLRDAAVSIVSRKTREFLLSPDGKDQLRKEIQTRINRYMTKPIENVYITDILIE